MIHRALYGSLERFMGILIEHFKGHLPFWIAPEQVRVMTITDEQADYAADIVAQTALPIFELPVIKPQTRSMLR